MSTPKSSRKSLDDIGDIEFNVPTVGSNVKINFNIFFNLTDSILDFQIYLSITHKHDNFHCTIFFFLAHSCGPYCY